MEHDDEHYEALKTTGFWGKAGAGCVFLARSTGRILISHRSPYVEQPNTWGSWGGAIDPNEDPADAVRREAAEEAGHNGPFNVLPLYVFHSGTFRYFNFLVIVPDEFRPVLNWENQGFKWCEFGKWPSPLHFGLKALFADPDSVRTIQQAINGKAQ
jgi:8-oxo-dGTP pyrophosphatase MutT (NUDIX family)